MLQKEVVIMKRVILVFLGLCGGLFFDPITLPARKALANFLVSSVWGAESPKEEEVEEEGGVESEPEGDEQSEARREKLFALQRQLIDLSFMLRHQERLPRAWHHDVPPNERKPVRLGGEIQNPSHRLSSREAARAILAATDDLPEPPPLNEMNDREVAAWEKIAELRLWAQFVLEGRRSN